MPTMCQEFLRCWDTAINKTGRVPGTQSLRSSMTHHLPSLPFHYQPGHSSPPVLMSAHDPCPDDVDVDMKPSLKT